METVAGVDGCPGGWVAAVRGDGGVEWRLLPLPLGPALDLLSDCAVVAIDVPIGVPEDGYRACDVLARAALGPARSSVFLTPTRAVLAAPDYPTACAVARAVPGPAPSVQTWAIAERIRDADRVFSVRGAQPGCVLVEAHPELSFLAMTGEVLPPKRSAPGLAARLLALGEHFGDVPALLRDTPRPARADDALDALACAWTARRVLTGQATRLGEDGMEIAS